MDKISTYMDLIAGIFLALDLFQKYPLLVKIYNKIKGFIKEIDTENFTKPKTMLFSGTLSIFLFIILLLGVYYKNSDNLNYNVWMEIGWFTLGGVVAWVLITLLAKLLTKIFMSIDVLLIFFIGLIISMLTPFLFLLHPTNELAALLTSFIYICFLYPFGMTIARTVKRILLADEKRPFYMFAVIGLFLFFVSKIYELIK